MSGIAQHDCEHDWESRTRGGEPLAVRTCRICRTVDWDDLREQHEREVTERAEKEAESATREATASLTELAPSSLLARAERAEAAIREIGDLAYRFGAFDDRHEVIDLCGEIHRRSRAALDSTDPEPASGPVVFLLWSGKWQSWWRPNAAGYTTDQARAGRYSEADALRHVRKSAMCGNLADVTSMVAAPDNWKRPTGPWWAVNHPGIGVLVYDDEGQARRAAGTAGTLLTRDAPDQSWREVA